MNGRPSGAKPKGTNAVSIRRASSASGPICPPIPTQTTLGDLIVGKAPHPAGSMRIGAICEAIPGKQGFYLFDQLRRYISQEFEREVNAFGPHPSNLGIAFP